MVVLKTLARAVADGDRIYCTVHGTAANHAGHGNWIMEPSSAAQEEAIRAACEQAGIEPQRIGYVEVHGTGTPKGDPVEAQALGAVVGAERDPRDPCRVGSVKTNIGHLDAAAGIAGLVKAALCVHHGELVPSLHFEQCNPAIPLDTLHLRVQTKRETWNAPERFAGVTSIGFGGTSAHVVIGSAPDGAAATRVARAPARVQVLPLSARSEAARKDMAARWVNELDAINATDLIDACYTASVRRAHHDFRLGVAGATTREIADRLRKFLAGDPSEVSLGRRNREKASKIVFVFPGHGPQWLGMGKDLLEEDPVFREAVTGVDELARQHIGWSIIDELRASESRSRLEEADVVQPVLFALQIGLTTMWRSWGVDPDVVVGHSFGEIAAAYTSGALSLEDAVRIVCHRGRVTQQQAGKGGVCVVQLPAKQVQPLLAPYPDLEIGGVNSPSATIVTGGVAALEAFLREMEKRDVFARRVKLAYASHSKQMDAVLPAFESAIGDVKAQAATIPFYSTVTGQLLDGTRLGADYWLANLRKPVRFAHSIDNLGRSHDIYLEVSPHPVLLTPIEQTVTWRGAGKPTLIPTLRRQAPSMSLMRSSLAAIYAAGLDPNWRKVFPAGRVRSTPTYPWQRERMWTDASTASAREPDTLHPLLGRYVEMADAHVWDGKVGGERTRYAYDHRLQGVPVLPASAFVEMMASGAAHVLGSEDIEISDLELPRALFLPSKGEYRLQLVLSQEGELWSARVHGRADDAGGSWRVHATARIARHSAQPPAAPDIDALIGRTGDKIASAACYLELQQLGLEYGPAFQGIEWLQRSKSELVARVAPPAGSELEPYFFHPAFHDACMHASVLAEPCLGHHGFVPVRIGRLRLHGRGTRALYSCAEVVPAGDRMRASVLLVDENKRVLQAVEGIELSPLDDSAPDETSSALMASWCYQVGWTEIPAPAAATPTAQPQRTWLIVADGAQAGAQLAKRMRDGGDKAVLVKPGVMSRKLDDNTFQLALDDDNGPREALASLRAKGVVPAGVVHLRSLDLMPLEEGSADVDALDDELRTSCGSARSLLRALEVAWPSQKVPVTWVTRGAHSVAKDGTPPAPLQAPLWGLARAAAHELPQLWGGLVDLDPRGTIDENVGSLWQWLSAPRAGEDEILLRGHSDGSGTSKLTVHGARLVRRPLQTGRELSIRRDAAYLVTGGLGGIGLEVARWLARSGAGQILLTARTPLPRDAWNKAQLSPDVAAKVKAVREIEDLGADVDVAAIDVADAKGLSSWIETRRRQSEPEIRGVFHLAGTVAIAELTGELDPLLSLARSKVHGGWALHTQFPDVDLFVLFSSASAVIRSPRLGHYAAGNAFLDALAHHRRARGKNAISIDWGLWSDVGYVQKIGLDKGPASIRGMRAISPSMGIRILERLLGSNDVQTVVWPPDWDEWARLYPAFTRTPFVTDLLDGAQQTQGGGGAKAGAQVAPRVATALADAPAAEKPTIVRDYLARAIAGRLRLPIDGLPMTTGLDRLGFDSLQAIELKTTLQQDLSVEIPIVRFLSGATVADVIALVIDKMQLNAPQAPTPSAPVVDGSAPTERRRERRTATSATAVVTAAEARQHLERLPQMSTPDLDALFERLMDS
ncbi:MAG TPA: type I polyketide synthase [Myxococcota bacterium]